MKPIKPIELSAADHRRILQWARLGAIQEIEAAENELARHLAIEQDNPNARAHVIPHRFGGNPHRHERIEQLRESLIRNRQTLARFIAIETQYKDATDERAAEGMVAAILANRREEREAEEAKRTISGEKGKP